MARRTPALVIIGAVVGIPILAICAVLFTPLGTQITDRFDEDFLIEKSVDLLVTSEGVNKALTTSYSEVEVGVNLFGSLWFTDFAIDDTTVTQTYQYRAPYAQLSEVFTESWDQKHICGVTLTKRFMAYGATFTNVYLDQAGTQIGSVTITAETCGITLY